MASHSESQTDRMSGHLNSIPNNTVNTEKLKIESKQRIEKQNQHLLNAQRELSEVKSVLNGVRTKLELMKRRK